MHNSSFIDLVNQAKQHIEESDIHFVHQHLNDQKFTLIDVREDSEWQAGYIPSAIHISKGVLERDLASHVSDKAQAIVLYCGGGFRSAIAAYNLQQMGYSNVKSMAGGIRDWASTDYPLTTP